MLAVVSALGFGLQRPSLEALVPQLVARDDLAAAASLSGLMGNARPGPRPAAGRDADRRRRAARRYLVDAASCVAGLVMFARLRSFPPEPEADRPSLRGIAEGLRYVRGRPEILGTYLIDIAAMFFGAPYALFPAVAARFGGAAALGLLYAAPGVRRAAGQRHRRLGRARAPARPGHRAGRLRLGRWPSPPSGWRRACGGRSRRSRRPAAADMISGIFRMTMWNQTIPSRLRGRLAGLEMISYTTGEPLGSLESGLAAR